MADHIAELIVEDLLPHPDELWDSVHINPDDTGLPPDLTKDRFGPFLATGDGKIWLLERRGRVRSGALEGVERCVKTATPKQVACLLAARSRDEVARCDEATK